MTGRRLGPCAGGEEVVEAGPRRAAGRGMGWGGGQGQGLGFGGGGGAGRGGGRARGRGRGCTEAGPGRHGHGWGGSGRGQGQGRGLGQGRGQGQGQGLGQGRGQGQGLRQDRDWDDVLPTLPPDDRANLEAQAEGLKETLARVEQQLSDLGDDVEKNAATDVAKEVEKTPETNGEELP